MFDLSLIVKIPISVEISLQRHDSYKSNDCMHYCNNERSATISVARNPNSISQQNIQSDSKRYSDKFSCICQFLTKIELPD